MKDKDGDLEKQPESDKYFSKNEYSFKGKYSLEYVSGKYDSHFMNITNYFTQLTKCITFRITFAQIENRS